jgi:glycosyltransferase involved in cell wall biosynthesis
MRIPLLPKSFDLTYIFINSLFKNKKIKWIAVNNSIQEQLIEKGVAFKQISIIPAYIKEIEKKELPKDISNFCAIRFPVLSIYAFSTNLYNGEDLYGVDMALDLTSMLKKKYKDVGLVVCIPGRKDKEIINKYQQFIDNNNLTDNVFLQYDKIDDCASLWAVSDIYLRPTNTDGDSLAVREALDVSCVPVVSDCVKRPEGSVLFANRNVVDLFDKVIEVINNKEIFVNAIPVSNDFYLELHKVLFDN